MHVWRYLACEGDMSIKKISCLVLLFLSVLGLIFIFNYNDFFSSTFSFWNTHDDEKYATTNSFQGCVAYVSCYNKEQMAVPFLNSNGDYYLVIPAKSDGFYLTNVSDDCSISVGKEILKKNDSFIEMDETSELIVSINDTERMHVLKSANISAMFINVDVSQDVLDAYKGVGYEGECVLLDYDKEKVITNSLEYIEPRGNTTMMRAKKPYNLKFDSDIQLVKGVKSKKWVLLANAIDNSLLKNATVYDFANEYTNSIVPDGDFVDLYINGDYRGNYFLCNRPQYIDTFLESQQMDDYKYLKEIGDGNDELEYVSNETGTAFGKLDNPSDVLGEDCLYLVEFTYQDVPPDSCGFYTQSGVWGRVALPKNASLGQVEYIKGKFDELEMKLTDDTMIEKDDFSQVDSLLDLESYISRYLIDNMFLNNDSGQASSWFYKKPDSLDKKIYAGPIWDYDSTLHNIREYDVWDFSKIGNVYLSAQLLNYTDFVSALKEQFSEVCKPYVKYEMPSKLHGLNEKISKSRELNNIRWNVSIMSKEAVIDDLIDVALDRVDAFESRILQDDLFCTVTFLDYDKRKNSISVVKRGESLEYIPKVNAWVAIFNGWRSTTDGSLLLPDTKIWEDTVYESEWIPMDLVVLNGLNGAGVNEDTVDIDALESVLHEIQRRHSEE